MITAARTFDDASCHYYTQDGKPVHTVLNKSTGGQRPTTVADCRKLGLLPSPTTILKLLHRPALEAWKIEQAVLATLTAPRRAGEALDAFVERILHTDEEQNQERDAAADLGSRIHKALSVAIWERDYDQSLRAYVDPVVNAVWSVMGKPVNTEVTLVADDYAGTTDAILTNDSEVWVVDFKCTKSIPDKPYREHRLQLSAYGGAICCSSPNEADIRQLGKTIRCANIYVSTKNPGEIKVCDLGDWSNDLKAFKLLVQYWRTVNNIQ